MQGHARIEYLACYGTLMSGFPCQEELGVRELLAPAGPCKIRGALIDLGEWPGLVAGEGVVEGELFRILDVSVFATLDPFEDCDPADPEGSSFLRSVVRLIEPDVHAWVYTASGPAGSGRTIASGSWYRSRGVGPPGGRG